MGKPLFNLLLVLAVVAVALADVMLKKAAITGNFSRALVSPWMVAALLLYLFQVVFFTYAFTIGWPLSIVGSLQTILYALIVIGAGVLFFKESLSVAQGAGILVAFAGIYLMSLESG